MHLPHYPYEVSNDSRDYEFISVGPNGSIRKAVRFLEIEENIFNLGFGDLDSTSGMIDDLARTNNNDSKKVLATIAAIVSDFMFSKEDAIILAAGNSLSRNRLYRIGISTNLNAINPQFEIFGYRFGKWEVFRKENEYESFFVRRKQIKFDIWER